MTRPVGKTIRAWNLPCVCALLVCAHVESKYDIFWKDHYTQTSVNKSSRHYILVVTLNTIKKQEGIMLLLVLTFIEITSRKKDWKLKLTSSAQILSLASIALFPTSPTTHPPQKIKLSVELNFIRTLSRLHLEFILS